jgi:hypothetical protein
MGTNISKEDSGGFGFVFLKSKGVEVASFKVCADKG